MPTVISALRIGLRAACVGVLVWTATLVALAAVLPAAYGGQRVVITSGSMEPGISPGDLVVIGPAPREPRQGDVVTFRDQAFGGLVTHRVVSRQPDGLFRTQGDANRDPDSTPLPADAVVGRAVALVPLVGRPVLWLGSGEWTPMVATAAVLAVVVWVLTGLRPSCTGREVVPGRRRPGARRRLAVGIGVVALALAVIGLGVSDARFTSAGGSSGTAQAASSFCGSGIDATWLTGFETGLVSVSGGGVFTSVTGTPTVASASARTASFGLRLAPRGGAHKVVRALTPQRYTVVRFAVRLVNPPTGSATLVSAVGSTGTVAVGVDGSTGRLSLGLAGGPQTLGSQPVVGAWQVVEVSIDAGVSPWTATWRINTLVQPAPTLSAAATTVGAIELGTSLAQTYTVDVDDVVVSRRAADHPIGTGGVLALRPTDLVTVNPSGSFNVDTGGAVDSSSPARLADSPFGSTTTHIRQTRNGSTAFVGLGLGDTTASCVRAVTATFGYHSAGTAANHGVMVIADGAVETTVFAGDMSETTLFTTGAIVTPATTWTTAAVNGLVARIGRSTDVSPLPSWDAIVVEVEYRP